MLIAHAVTTTLLAASSSSKNNGGSATLSLVFLVVIFAVAYFFFLRPRSQAARRQRETLTELSAGDEVLTGAGIFGRVLDVEGDRVTIETAPGTRITVLRSTIARKLNEPAESETSWHDEEREGVGWEGDEHDEHDEHGEHDDAEPDEHDLAGHDDESSGRAEVTPVGDESHTDEGPHAADEPGTGRRASGEDRA